MRPFSISRRIANAGALPPLDLSKAWPGGLAARLVTSPPSKAIMLSEPYLPDVFQAIRDKDEKFLWVGKPARVPFVISGIPFLIFGTCWFSFDYFFLRHVGGKNGIPLGFAIPFFAIHLFPFWASVLNMLRLVMVVGNTYYAVSSKRLLMRTGFWGT